MCLYSRRNRDKEKERERTQEIRDAFNEDDYEIESSIRGDVPQFKIDSIPRSGEVVSEVSLDNHPRQMVIENYDDDISEGAGHPAIA